MPVFTDSIPPQHGHWKMEVWDGPDLLRGPLTDAELERNAQWDAEQARGLLRTFRHRGPILNELLHVFEGDNLITTVGKQLLLDRFCGVAGAGAALTSLSVGTSATAAAVGNTSLTGQVNQVFDSTPTRATLTVTMLATFAAGTATINWQEMGAWNGSTLASRIAPIGNYNKNATDIITLTYQIVQS